MRFQKKKTFSVRKVLEICRNTGGGSNRQMIQTGKKKENIIEDDEYFILQSGPLDPT